MSGPLDVIGGRALSEDWWEIRAIHAFANVVRVQQVATRTKPVAVPVDHHILHPKRTKIAHEPSIPNRQVAVRRSAPDIAQEASVVGSVAVRVCAIPEGSRVGCSAGKSVSTVMVSIVEAQTLGMSIEQAKTCGLSKVVVGNALNRQP